MIEFLEIKYFKYLIMISNKTLNNYNHMNTTNKIYIYIKYICIHIIKNSYFCLSYNI